MWSFQKPKEKTIKSAQDIFSFLKQNGIIKDKQEQRVFEDFNKTDMFPKERKIKDPEIDVDDDDDDEMDYNLEDAKADSGSEYVPETELGSDEESDIIKFDNKREFEDFNQTAMWTKEGKRPPKIDDDDDDDEDDSMGYYLADAEGDSGSEYVPETEFSSDGESAIIQNTTEHVSTMEKQRLFFQNVPSTSTSHQKSFMKVSSGDKRKYDKKHSCLFCSKMYSKIARHLEQKHKNELEVAEALAHNKGSKERKKKLQLLLHRGDFKHNKSVASSNNGCFIPARRQKTDSALDDFTTCQHCLGLFLKKDLWRHKKKCSAIGKDNQKQTREKNHNLLLISVKETDGSAFSEKILNTMASDKISLICRQDSTLLKFGKHLFGKFVDQPQQYQYVKQKMRELARFLNEMREQAAVESIAQCINPIMFSDVIKTVKILAKFNSGTGTYETPSVALKIGHSLRACADIIKSNAIQTQDDDLEKQADSFTKLYASDWAHEISSRALNTLHKIKFNTTRRLPLASDVRKLYTFLKTRADTARIDLSSKPKPTTWKNLAAVSLAQIVLFNRRRGGEMQRMKVKEYQDGLISGKCMQGEIMKSLSNFERSLAQQLERVEIRGKRGRRVPVLLTKYHKESIELLLDHRESAGLDEDNPYIFGQIGSSKAALRTSDILRKFATECGADKPNLLTSTSLRKHIGTICQLLNLKENELDALATFMGHDKSVHKDYYRLPEDTMQLAKVSKVLLQLEKGTIDKCKGKSLDELEFSEDDKIEDDELSAEENDLEMNLDEDGKNIQTEESHSKQERQKKRSSSSNKVFTKSTFQRKEWSQEEKEAVDIELSNFFYLKRLPGKSVIENARTKQPALANRPWKQIKYYVKNIQTKNKAKML